MENNHSQANISLNKSIASSNIEHKKTISKKFVNDMFETYKFSNNKNHLNGFSRDIKKITQPNQDQNLFEINQKANSTKSLIKEGNEMNIEEENFDENNLLVNNKNDEFLFEINDAKEEDVEDDESNKIIKKDSIKILNPQEESNKHNNKLETSDLGLVNNLSELANSYDKEEVVKHESFIKSGNLDKIDDLNDDEFLVNTQITSSSKKKTYNDKFGGSDVKNENLETSTKFGNKKESNESLNKNLLEDDNDNIDINEDLISNHIVTKKELSKKSESGLNLLDNIESDNKNNTKEVNLNDEKFDGGYTNFFGKFEDGNQNDSINYDNIENSYKEKSIPENKTEKEVSPIKNNQEAKELKLEEEEDYGGFDLNEKDKFKENLKENIKAIIEKDEKEKSEKSNKDDTYFKIKLDEEIKKLNEKLRLEYEKKESEMKDFLLKEINQQINSKLYVDDKIYKETTFKSKLPNVRASKFFN